MNKRLYSWYFLREYFFPRGCGICCKMLLTKEEAMYGLCEECSKSIIIEDGERCESCGRPLISEIGRCLPCRRTEGASCDRIISIFPYLGRYIKLLRAFKFDRSLGAGHFLAEKILEALKLLPMEEMKNPVLIPIPPRAGKIRKTGWDQIDALAGILKQKPDTPRIKSCLKRQASQTQKSLDRKDRQINLKGRIIAKKNIPKECILFDDVITTGSTMNACAAALKDGGAEKVFGICLFYD